MDYKLLNPIPVKVVKPDEFGNRWFYGLKALAYGASRGTFTWLAYLAVDEQNAAILDKRWQKKFGKPFPFAACSIEGHKAIQGGFATGELKVLDGGPDPLPVRLNGEAWKLRDFENVRSFLDNLDVRSRQRVELIGDDGQGGAISLTPFNNAEHGWLLRYDELKDGDWVERTITVEEFRQRFDLKTFFVSEIITPRRVKTPQPA